MNKPLFLFGLLTGLGSAQLSAQEATRALTVTPSVGFGMVANNGRLESGGMSTLLQIDLSGSSVRWGVFGSVRGIGVGCSNGCDLSGQALGSEMTFLLGDVGVGAGLGLIHRFTGWHAQPHGKLSLDVGALRMQLRVEVSSGGYLRTYIPLLLGRPIHVS